MIAHDQMIARTCVHRLEGASGSAGSLRATSWLVPWRGSGYAGASRGIPLGISVTDLEIEEAIREAWAVLSAASPSARRLTVLADQGAWLASWGPRPGEPNCRVPPALLPETQARHENAYALWRSAVRTSDEVASESKTPRMR